MKLINCKYVFVLFALVVFVSQNAEAGLVWGNSALEFFEMHRERNLDMYIDFENTPTGLHSTLPEGIGGGTIKLNVKKFNLATTEFRYPLPEIAAPVGTKVAVLPYDYIKAPSNHRLMGITAGNIPDGQSKYEIVFNTCLDRVGLYRQWNTYSITRFYQQNRLLAEHRNTYDDEFVGYFNDLDAVGDDCVTRVEFDGYPSTPGDENNKLYQVGEVDDLFYSVPGFYSLILVNRGDTAIVSAGDQVLVQIYLKNLASYIMKDVSCKTEYPDHMANKTVSSIETLTLEAAGDEDDDDSRNMVFEIETAKDTRSGYYKINVSIRSSSNVLVEELTSWYFVKGRAVATPSINILLQKGKK